MKCDLQKIDSPKIIINVKWFYETKGFFAWIYRGWYKIKKLIKEGLDGEK